MRGRDRVRRLARSVKGLDDSGERASPLQGCTRLSKFIDDGVVPTDVDSLQILVTSGRRVLAGLTASGATGLVPRRTPLSVLLHAYRVGGIDVTYLNGPDVEEQPAPAVPALWRGVARDVDGLADRLLVLRREAVSEVDWKGL